jgi:hypothetical protein
MMYELTGMGDIVALSTAGDGPHGRKLSEKKGKGKGKESKKGKGSATTSPEEELKDCDNGQVDVTFSDCCEGRRLGGLMDQPWVHPNATDEATLVANDPGIWKTPGFLDDDLVERLLQTLGENGDGTTRFQRCVGSSHDHLERKKCFRLSSETARDADEGALVEELLERLNWLWPTDMIEQRDYMYVQRTEGGCGPTGIHKDLQENDITRSATATVVFYLTDGGAGVFFPNANITITPQRGMALTWLNVHPDGSYNGKAGHGIQATPDGTPARISLSYRINFPQHAAASSRN